MRQHEIEYTTCVECGNPIAKTARICPHCGAQQPTTSDNASLGTWLKWIGYAIVWFIGVIIGMG